MAHRRWLTLIIAMALFATLTLVIVAPVAADIGIAGGFSMPTGDTTPSSPGGGSSGGTINPLIGNESFPTGDTTLNSGSGGSSGGTINPINGGGPLPMNDTTPGSVGGSGGGGSVNTTNPADTNLPAAN